MGAIRVSLRRTCAVLAIAAVAACDSSNVIGPANQLQVTNATDDFQFQVTDLGNVTQTLTYSWANTGDSASINQSSAITGGSATLTVRGPTGTQLYQSNLTANGTFFTALGATGNWQIQVVLNKADGDVNFRIQKTGP